MSQTRSELGNSVTCRAPRRGTSPTAPWLPLWARAFLRLGRGISSLLAPVPPLGHSARRRGSGPASDQRVSATDRQPSGHRARPIRLRHRVKRPLLRWLLGLLSLAARTLPLRLLHFLGDALGEAAILVAARRLRLADQNLRQVFGDRLTAQERRRILSFSVRNTCKTALELLRLPTMSDAEFNRLVAFANPEVLDEVAALGRGAIVITAHFGNWEMLAAAIAKHGHRLVVLANDAPDVPTAALVNAARRSVGVDVLDRSQVRELFRALQEGCFVGILPDQRARREGGLVLDFLGRPARTYTGPAALALRTGAMLLPCFARRTEDNRIICYCREPIPVQGTGDRDADVLRVTQMVNHALEREILRYPAQWLWLHDRWGAMRSAKLRA